MVYMYFMAEAHFCITASKAIPQCDVCTKASKSLVAVH